MNKPITNSKIGDPGDLIKVLNLCKYFDDVLEVDNISFSIRKGELFGFLGPNGAGKTTTINMLTGLARPDSGSIHIAGLNCSRNPKAANILLALFQMRAIFIRNSPVLITFVSVLLYMGWARRKCIKGQKSY